MGNTESSELICRRVRGLLAEHQVSGAELARRLGWTQSYVARRIRGRVAWRADELAGIARELSVEVGDLLPVPDKAPAA